VVLGVDQHDTHGDARGGLSELSLALAPVAPSLQGLHLCILQRMGVLTEVLAVISKVGHGLATRKQRQGKSARSQGPCGAPLASVLLPSVTVAPLPQQPIGLGRGAVKRCGGERMSVSSPR
jgi:hypothetical protein